ncbi:hypothetical protein QIS99_29665 [Streptomyces sp. B-S-A8]|uniref:Uncharacterized protein n=1 Tax=Streptomyces solicavernae TaxID=3043614 RepID=A0ABT6S0Y1_9ACTN|nr:hypothetical protein [Streptomyces sp. B-S-A8]MDI3390328.1 hypothetical protein [Streptomyces sp. B-S-A8]
MGSSPTRPTLPYRASRSRSALEVGFARSDCQLALLVQRSDQADKALEELEERVASLEKTGWALP